MSAVKISHQKISAAKIEKLINKPALFVGRWRFHAKDRKKAEAVLSGLLKTTRAKKIFVPEIAFCFLDRNEIQRSFSLKMPLKTAKDKLPLQLVTIGSRASKELRRLYKKQRFVEYFFLYGLAAEMTEALAKFCHLKLQKKMRAKNSRRISVGYKIWPDLSDQRKICRLLQAKKIGVSLSSSLLLNPEFSTSALIVY